MSGDPAPAAKSAGRSGRPTRAAAERLDVRILGSATASFLRDGFAATSMEAVAGAAGVSKRTLYHRYADKPALLRGVVAALVAQWRPSFDDAIGQDQALPDALRTAARNILGVALLPDALALHRLIVAETARIPQLGLLLREAGVDVGARAIAARLRREYPDAVDDPDWAAEQFMHLVLTGPQRRQLGLGAPLDGAELERWVERSVALFLRGLGTAAEPNRREMA